MNSWYLNKSYRNLTGRECNYCGRYYTDKEEEKIYFCSAKCGSMYLKENYEDLKTEQEKQEVQKNREIYQQLYEQSNLPKITKLQPIETASDKERLTYINTKITREQY